MIVPGGVVDWAFASIGFLRAAWGDGPEAPAGIDTAPDGATIIGPGALAGA